MFKSTFISIGLHAFFIIFAYYGLPSFKVKEPTASPIDIVEDTPISSKTSLKLGKTKVKEVKEVKEIKKVIKKEKVKKTPPPPPAPSKKMVEKKNEEIKKKKEKREIAELIKKKQNINPRQQPLQNNFMPATLTPHSASMFPFHALLNKRRRRRAKAKKRIR